MFFFCFHFKSSTIIFTVWLVHFSSYLFFHFLCNIFLSFAPRISPAIHLRIVDKYSSNPLFSNGFLFFWLKQIFMNMIVLFIRENVYKKQWPTYFKSHRQNNRNSSLQLDYLFAAEKLFIFSCFFFFFKVFLFIFFSCSKCVFSVFF